MVYGIFKYFPTEVGYGNELQTRVEGDYIFVMIADNLKVAEDFCLKKNKRLFEYYDDLNEYKKYDKTGVYYKEGKIKKRGYYVLPLEFYKYSDSHIDYDTGKRYYEFDLEEYTT